MREALCDEVNNIDLHTQLQTTFIHGVHNSKLEPPAASSRANGPTTVRISPGRVDAIEEFDAMDDSKAESESDSSH